MTGLVLLLAGVGVGILIGAALFAGPPANMERRRYGHIRFEPPIRPAGYVPAPPPPPPVRNGGIGKVPPPVQPPPPPAPPRNPSRPGY